MGLFSFAQVTTRGDSYALDLMAVHYNLKDHQVTLMDYWLLAVIVGCASVMSIVTIFLYKNRKIQITLSKLNMLLYLSVIFIVFYTGDEALSYIRGLGLEGELSYKLGAVLPIISVILVFFASRAIKKDEDLVRSADRIR